MTGRPIIFSAPMIRAKRAGLKTQTRRVLHPQPELCDPQACRIHLTPNWQVDATGLYYCASCGNGVQIGRDGYPARYAVGDRLWVREAWRTAKSLDEFNASEIAQKCLEAGYRRPWAPIIYLADDERSSWEGEEPGRYRHPRFMPRWASRSTLVVTAAKIEPLQAIGENGAKAEGMQEPSLRELGGDLAQAAWSEREMFRRFWDRLHGGSAWSLNPWVQAATFTVHHANIDALAKEVAA